jgi:hypothetical protein
MYRLGLNNPPRICHTPRKSRVRDLGRNKQGTVDVKLRVLEFTELPSSRSNTAVCHNKNNPLANRSQVDCGLPCSALRLQGMHAVRSGRWQSALKLILLTVAICRTVILFLAV